MRKYRQITTEERYTISCLRKQGWSSAAIAKELGRHRSTICREVRRNADSQGHYTVEKAVAKAKSRQANSRKVLQYSFDDWCLVVGYLKRKWSPDQISRFFRLTKALHISHETIYRYLLADKRNGGDLYKCLRHSRKRRRKRYGAYDSRGVMRGKRPLDIRPKGAENRSRKGHFEIDTVLGTGSKHCIMTLVDRKTGYLIIRKLRARTTKEVNSNLYRVLKQEQIRTITADNGTEFHQFKQVEENNSVRFYFAKPYHSWERGSNENANGLIRQYLPKGQSMTLLTQRRCDEIATEINERPRKRYGYRTPKELYYR